MQRFVLKIGPIECNKTNGIIFIKTHVICAHLKLFVWKDVIQREGDKVDHNQ